MYELILLILTGCTAVLAYIFACRLLVVSSMNCPSIQLHSYLHSHQQTSFFDVFRCLIVSLTDTEQGYFVRLSTMISNSIKTDKSKVQLSWLATKLSQCVVTAALFLPITLFLGYLVVVVITGWFSRKKLSLQFFGVIFGLGLMKFCIDFVLFLYSINTEVIPEEIPGYLYLDYAIHNPWMFILNGFLFVPFTINLFMALPVIFVVGIILKLTVFQLLLMFTGFFLGLAIKSFGQSRKLRGVFYALLQENAVFYFLWFLWVVVAIAGFNIFYPQLLSWVFVPEYLLGAAAFLSFLALLAVLCFDVVNPHGIVMMDIFHHKTVQGGKILYKHSKKLFRETTIGTTILMNEIRKYSAKQSIYFEKTQAWYENKRIQFSDLEKIHNKFEIKAKELQSYLAVIQKSHDITFNEQGVAICSKFLEGANNLEKNFYEKCKLLAAEQDEEVRISHSPFFSDVIEAEDAVFFVYESVVKMLDMEDIESLSKILEHRSGNLTVIEHAYISTRQDLVPENEKSLALELVNIYQINLWQISKQNELLEQWVKASS